MPGRPRTAIRCCRGSSAAEISFFTVPKPCHGHVSLIQRNAIASWAAAAPGGQILLFGDEPGVAAAAAELGVTHVPDMARTPYGAPRLDDVFRQAHGLATHDTLCVINADILFRGDLSVIAACTPPFLVIGDAIDADVRAPIDFTRADRANALADIEGVSRGPLAIDFFFFNRGLFRDVPPFAIGRARFDNWLVWRAIASGAAVIHGRRMLQPIHQRHAYGHLPGGHHEAYRGADARRKQSLAGWQRHVYLYSIPDARWTLTPAGLERRSRWLAALTQYRVRLSGFLGESLRRPGVAST